MEKKANVGVIVLIILLLISLSIAGACFLSFTKEREKNISLEQQLDDTKTKQLVTEEKLKKTEKLVSDLQQKLDSSNSQIKTLTDNLEQERAAKQESLDKLEQIKTDLEQQKLSRADLEKKVGQAQDDVNKLNSQLQATEARKAELEKKLKEFEDKAKGVELGNIVVSQEPSVNEAPAQEKKAGKAKEEKKSSWWWPWGHKEKAAAPAPERKNYVHPAKASVKPALRQMDGNIMVVNKEYNFAVINMGIKDGVVVDQVFMVYHNGVYTGDIKIEKVHDAMSAAGFLTPDLKDKVSEGDRVVKK